MKGRLSSTLWTLAIDNALALLIVFGLAYSAGAWAKGLPLSDAFGVSEAGTRLLGAGLFILVGLVCAYLMLSKVITPVKELTDFSEKWGAGDYRAKVDIDSSDDFGLIAENLNRSAE